MNESSKIQLYAFINLIKAIKQRNKIYKSSKDTEIKFLEGKNVSHCVCHTVPSFAYSWCSLIMHGKKTDTKLITQFPKHSG